MAEKPREINEERAMDYFQRAIKLISTESIVMEQEERYGAAMNYMFQAAQEWPQNSEILNNLIIFFLKLAVLDLPRDIEQQIREYIRSDKQIAKSILKEVLQSIKVRDSLKNPYYKADIKILELIIEESDEAEAATVFLSQIYGRIGKIELVDSMLLEIAKKNPEMAIYYINFCYEQNKFEDCIKYYEEESPDLPSWAKTYMATMYQAMAHGLTFQEKKYRFENGTQPQDYEAIQKAQKIFSELCEERKEGIEYIDALISYGQLILEEAYLCQRDKEPDKFNGFLETLDAAIEVLVEVLIYINDLDENLGIEWRKKFLRSKLNLAGALIMRSKEISDLNSAIHLLMNARIDSEAVEELGCIPEITNNLAAAFQQKLMMTQELNERTEKLLWGSFFEDWDNAVSIKALIDFYQRTGNVEKMRAVAGLGEDIPILKNLLMVDIYSHEPNLEAMAISIYRVSEEDNDGIVEGEVSIDEHFRPLREALEPYMERFMERLKAILPKGAEIVPPRIKSAPSMFLKALKEGKDNLMNVTDIVGFRVLTRTEEDAKEFYEKVKKLFKEDPEPKEWITLEEPTPTNYRSMDITGYTDEEDSFLVQVQIRSKRIDEALDSGTASHEYYKVKSGTTLKEKVDKDPIKYVKLLRQLRINLTMGYRFLLKEMEKRELSLEEILDFYRNPPIR